MPKIKPYLYELVGWCVLPLLFILAYINITASSIMLIPQHFYVVFLLLFLVQITRYFINLVLQPQWLRHHLVTLLYATTLFGMVGYYALVLFGLKTWKHVITKELISTYSTQMLDLLETVQISFALVVLCTSLLFLLIYFIIYQLIKKYDWAVIRFKISKSLILILCFSLMLFFAYRLMQYLTVSNTASKEPIKLTMFAGYIPSSSDANQGLPVNQQAIAKEIHTTQNYQPNPQAKKRNLIILVVDALRPDHTNIYGYQRSTTPYLNSLQAAGQLSVLPNIKSTCAETTCAHAALLASRYTQDIVPNMLTLQAVLNAHDYTSRFIISGDHRKFYNIKEIYGRVTHYFDGGMQKKYYINDDHVILDATTALPVWDGKPVMMQYHLLSAHNLGRRFPAFKTYLPAKNYSGMLNSQPEAKFTNYYDNGVLQTDWEIKQLLATLKTKGYLESTLVIITADHGESLGEHGVFIHTNSVYEQPLHVPLMYISYGFKTTIPNNFNQMASLIDIAPSILNDFEMPIPATWQGQALQQFKTRDLTHFMMRPRVGFYDHTDPKTLWKYWFNEETSEEFAYNLTADPQETQNTFNKAPTHLKQKWQTYKLTYINNLMQAQQQKH